MPIEIPDAPTPPKLDGNCADSAYDDAVAIDVDAGSQKIVVRMIHSDGSLYVSICGIPYTPFVGVASQLDIIELNGRDSNDPDGDSLTYLWTQISGPVVNLTGGTSATPTFSPPSVDSMTSLSFELTVNDGEASSDAVTSSVILLPDPTPYAGPGVSAGEQVIVIEEEYLEGTDMVEVLFAGQPGETHNILRSLDPDSWALVATREADPMGRFQYSEFSENFEDRVFYQAEKAP